MSPSRSELRISCLYVAFKLATSVSAKEMDGMASSRQTTVLLPQKQVSSRDPSVLYIMSLQNSPPVSLIEGFMVGIHQVDSYWQVRLVTGYAPSEIPSADRMPEDPTVRA